MDPMLCISLEITSVRPPEEPDRGTAPTDYILRLPDAAAFTRSFAWSKPLLTHLQTLRRIGRDQEAEKYVLTQLRELVAGPAWDQQEARIIQAHDEQRPVALTLRFASAELYCLPWELLPLKRIDRALCELPKLLLRFEWLGARSAKPASAQAEKKDRICFAWSAAQKSVPASDHLAAIVDACASGAHRFDRNTDFVSDATPLRIKEALSTARAPEAAVTVLHLLCHGSEFGILLNGRDTGVTLNPSQLHFLEPFAPMVRLVFLSACDAANPGPPDQAFPSIAQVLHDDGFQCVIAARAPLSTAGSILFTQEFYRRLLGDPTSVEQAFLSARQQVYEQELQLPRESHTLDWANLRLFAREQDGTNTRPIAIQPYCDTHPFAFEQRRFFFGRQPEIDEVLRALRAQPGAGPTKRLVLVTGASGCGKSSLVFAGVAPALRQAVPNLSVLSLRPGTAPAQALSDALASRVPGTPTLVVIDQLEELFTHVESRELRADFIRQLVELASAADPELWILATLNAAFLARWDELSVGGEMLSSSRSWAAIEHRIPPLKLPTPLREIIEEPAGKVGLQLDAGLSARLVADVGTEPGTLPLLEHTLHRLWEHREERKLTHAAYDGLQRFGGIVVQWADQVYAELKRTNLDERLVRRLLVHLAQVGSQNNGDTRFAVPLSSLHKPFASADKAAVERVVHALVRHRLIVQDYRAQRSTLELVHGALVRSWPVLKNWLSSSRTGRAAQLFQVPPRDPLFTGRDEFLRELQSNLLRARAVSLWGPDGMGKSAIAAEYVHRNQQSYSFVAWLQAADAGSLREDLHLLAGELVTRDLVPGMLPADPREQLDFLWNALTQSSDWLLVYDGIDELAALQGLLPPTGFGYLLCTTTNSAALAQHTHLMEVQALSEAETQAWLRRRSGHVSSPAELTAATALVTALDRQPLAIAQTGFYLSEEHALPSEFLNSFQARRTASSTSSPASPEPAPIATVWQMMLDAVAAQSAAAADVLMTSAFWASTFIPDFLLLDAAHHLGQHVQAHVGAAADTAGSVDGLLEPLLRWRLVERSEPGGVSGYQLHPLLQEVIRGSLDPDSPHALQAVQALEAVFPNPVTFREWARCRALLPSVKALQRQRAYLTAATPMAVPAAALWQRAAIYSFEQGSYEDARSLIEASLEVRRRSEDTGALALVDAMDTLTDVLVAQQDAQAAVLTAEQAVALRLQARDIDTTGMARTRARLASALRASGALERALEECRTSRDLLEQRYGSQSEHPDLVATLSLQASLFSDQERMVEAEQLYTHCLSIRQRQLGPDHPDTARLLHQLALHWEQVGRLREAEHYYKHSLSAQAESLGVAHPHTLLSSNQLAGVLAAQGRLLEAEKLYEDSLTRCLNAFGEEHLETARAQKNLGAYYYYQSRFEAAEPLERRCLKTRQEQLGALHPETRRARCALAETLSKQDRTRRAQAEQLHQDFVQHCRKVSGDDSLDTAAAYVSQGFFFYSQERIVEAEKAYHSAYVIREKRLGADHPDTVKARLDLADAIDEAGRYREAEVLYQRNVDCCRESGSRPALAVALRQLAAFYFRDSCLAKSVAAYAESRMLYEQYLGREHQQTYSLRMDLADALNKCGQPAAAESEYQDLVALRQQREQPDEGLGTADALLALGAFFYNADRPIEAARVYERCLKIRERHLGATHADTLRAREYLADSLVRQQQAAEAERLYLNFLTSCDEKAESLATASAAEALGGFYYQQKRMDEAARIEERCHAIRQRLLGETHEETLRIQDRLAETQQALGHSDRAKTLRKLSHDHHVQRLGAEAPATVVALANLGELSYSLGELADAERAEREVLRIRQRVLGPAHRDTLQAARHLAETLSRQRQRAEAERLFKECVDQTTNNLGLAHPDTAYAFKTLGEFYARYGGIRMKRNVSPLLQQSVEIMSRARGEAHPQTRELVREVAALLQLRRPWWWLGSILGVALVVAVSGHGQEPPSQRQASLPPAGQTAGPAAPDSSLRC